MESEAIGPCRDVALANAQPVGALAVAVAFEAEPRGVVRAWQPTGSRFCDAARAGVGDFTHAPTLDIGQHAAMHLDAAPADPRRSAPRGARADADPAHARVDDILPVLLFEDVAGRLVLVDARYAALRQDDGPLLRIGRARIVLRHLGAQVTARLLADGRVVVEGADALNVLLAFADELGAARR